MFPIAEGRTVFGFRKLLERVGKPLDFSLLLTRISVEIPLSLTFCSDRNTGSF